MVHLEGKVKAGTTTTNHGQALAVNASIQHQAYGGNPALQACGTHTLKIQVLQVIGTHVFQAHVLQVVGVHLLQAGGHVIQHWTHVLHAQAHVLMVWVAHKVSG